MMCEGGCFLAAAFLNVKEIMVIGHAFVRHAPKETIGFPSGEHKCVAFCSNLYGSR